jgi:hypothetical protein
MAMPTNTASAAMMPLTIIPVVPVALRLVRPGRRLPRIVAIVAI